MAHWFRLYDEVVDDPKVQRLSPELFKSWINLLCLASRNNGVLPPVIDLEFNLRMKREDIEKLVSELRQHGLIDETKKGVLKPHAWEKRQYKSDTSTDRVKRFRERSKDVTGNVSKSLHETDQIQSRTETEQKQKTEQNRTERPPSFPLDGTISYGHWAQVVRSHKKNLDPDWVASQFRTFCRDRDIDLSSPSIGKTFDSFVAAQKRA